MRPFSVCYASGMDHREQPKNGGKRPLPSYEEGELRDKSIEEKMDPGFKRGDSLRAIRDAAKGRKA